MMLYVFHVDVGRMLSFDMNVAMSSVENLKETIQRLHSIPAANIVLLVSGGEMLTPSTQVSRYKAGTDTNPIYMFLTGDERLAPTIASGADTSGGTGSGSGSGGGGGSTTGSGGGSSSGSSSSDASDAELRRQVEDSHKLPAVLETVSQRAQLAKHMRELGKNMGQLCERLVYEQHLQQQGWCAVVANMEDLTNEFCERFQNFCLAFDRHLQQRERYLELLRNFGVDLTQLARIPILPALMAQAEADFHGFDELLDDVEQLPAAANAKAQVAADAEPGESVEKSSSSTSPNKKQKMGHEQEEQAHHNQHQQHQYQLNLLQWISSKGNHATLQQMCDESVQGLETFSQEIYDKLKLEGQNIIKGAKQGDVKEIKGLSDRLYRLDEFKDKIFKMVKDQREQATAVQKNQSRALNLRDNSVLPDLCLSHRSQLQVMLDNHLKIREYCRCIANSKEELGRNLHMRLRHIVWIENGMSEYDNRLLFYLRCLRRAERHIGIIEQIHRAPSTYVAAVTEVVRRKIFSDKFRVWATRLSADFNRIHGEELQRRRLFNASFEGHFLNILFPGMADMPPTFANEHQELSFDTRLPQLSRSDIELLSSQLPELAEQLELPDMTPVLQFFVEHRRESEESASQQEDASQQKAPPTRQSVSTSTGETTTVVEQMERSTATDQLLQISAGTLTDESGPSVERLQRSLRDMSQLALKCLAMSRSNLSSLREELLAFQQDELLSDLQHVQEKWQLLRMQSDRQSAVLDQMREQLLAAEQQKVAAVAQAREQLIHEHKTELESLRCRFKLMTSMERSPSDSSLEKLERPTSSASVASCLDVEHLLAQQRQDLLAQQERAISEAVDAERALWQQARPETQQLPSLQPNSESALANVSILKGMLDDKDRQLDMLREQNRLLTQESYELKSRLNQLTNEDGNSWMKEIIDYLNRDKSRLEEELSLEKSKRLEMESSVAAMRTSTSEIGTLTRSKSVFASSSGHRSITLEGCGKGDLVFVVWSIRHGQFMVVQDSLTLYFVHADSLPALQLSPPAPTPALATVLEVGNEEPQPAAESNQIPLPYYAIGRVIDKEYCQARKDENRYRVSKGSKFYRIKLAPLPSRTSRRERLESVGAISRSQLSTAVRDAVDASMVSAATSLGASSSVYQSFKERTVSISSVNEEEEESASLISERCRYISVSEEDELQALAAAAAGGAEKTPTASTTTLNEALGATTTASSLAAAASAATQAQSVITEQPTASRKLKLDLLLASADIITQPLTQQQQQQHQQQEEQQAEQMKHGKKLGEEQRLAATESDPAAESTDEPVNIYVPSAGCNQDVAKTVATTAATAGATVAAGAFSEDSDEYRSLEGKDEADFPVSE
ncbi:hypothetical protein KR222_000213 [Zaprionus bogoriensis]|nr:hypothetical protein KR222_000213 [Zaprionus bogoriensis]